MAKSFRVKVRDSKGKLKTVGSARTPRGLKGAFTRAREKYARETLTVVEPGGTKHLFDASVKSLKGTE